MNINHENFKTGMFGYEPIQVVELSILTQWICAFCYTQAINALLDLELELMESNVCTIDEIKDMIDNKIFEIETLIIKEKNNDN